MPAIPPFDAEMWKDRLRGAGLRVTAARLCVLRVLHDSPLTLSAQEVLNAAERGGEADRVTVYRTLNALVEAGIAHRVDPGDRVWRFGLIAGEHGQHAHFVCDACGTISCLEDATITVSLRGRSSPDRFRVTQQDVYLHGTCGECMDGPVKKKRGRAPSA
jgi:Fur family ferric uptake transcriptional regulator